MGKICKATLGKVSWEHFFSIKRGEGAKKTFFSNLNAKKTFIFFHDEFILVAFYSTPQRMFLDKYLVNVKLMKIFQRISSKKRISHINILYTFLDK